MLRDENAVRMGYGLIGLNRPPFFAVGQSKRQRKISVRAGAMPPIAFRNSAQASKGVRRNAQDVFERARKMKLIPKSRAFRHLFDQRAWLFQPLRRQIHFEPHQKFIWALVVVPLKKPAKIGCIQMTFARELFEAFEPLEIFFDMLAAMLVAQQGKRLRAFVRDPRFADPQGQALQKFRAQFIRARPAPLPALD